MQLITINGWGTEIFNEKEIETTYETLQIQVKSKVYSITIARGRNNYYFIRLENGNRMGGKNFATLDLAIDSYKSIEMKAALMQIR
jgi:hypothetical protein